MGTKAVGGKGGGSLISPYIGQGWINYFVCVSSLSGLNWVRLDST